MARFANAVLFTPVAGGTVDFVVSAAVQGYMTPALAGAPTGVYKYRAESADLSEWEIGEGTYTSGTTTITRTTVLYNSAGTGSGAGQSGAGSKINFTVAPNVSIGLQMVEDTLQFDDDMLLTTAQQAKGKKNIAVPAIGQCVLTKVSTNLVLSPKNGNMLTVNGVQCTVPDAGVTLAATSLSAGTTYYIYVTASAGVVNALEASTTAHATSTTVGNKGVEIKSGDDARTLVGMARVITGPAWVDTVTQRFVRSWFNRVTVQTSNKFTATRTTSSATFVEINSEIRNEFLIWSDEAVSASFAGSAYNSSTTGGLNTGISVDGSATPEDGSAYAEPSATNTVQNQACSTTKSGLSEGYHYLTIIGKVGSGTGNWYLVGGSIIPALTATIR